MKNKREKSKRPILLLHYRDLRLEDHYPLYAALREKRPILPLYILSEEDRKKLKENGKYWLNRSLMSLKNSYQEIGSDLLIVKGSLSSFLFTLIKKNKADLFYHEYYSPFFRKEEKKLKKRLQADPSLKDIEIRSFDRDYLIHPENILTKKNTPYTIFSFYHDTLRKILHPKKPIVSPKKIPPPPSIKIPKKAQITPSLDLLRKSKDLSEHPLNSFWEVGEKGAKKKFSNFLKNGYKKYAEFRNYPAQEVTSKLSPHLTFGEINANTICYHLLKKKKDKNQDAFLQEIIWREFARYLLYHFPSLETKNFDPIFDHFSWKNSPILLKKWKEGKTGYPFIDAAMRELVTTGWMHNRARMVVASFLIKDLNIDWRKGAKWFFEKLVDGDVANNILGWQWSAGSGPNAQFFLRIFNPSLQSKRYDPEAVYIKKYLPSLKDISSKELHTLKEPTKKKGEKKKTIEPIIDHEKAKKEAKRRYQTAKKEALKGL